MERNLSTRKGEEVRVTVEGVEGPPGPSAYEVWLEQGNTGDVDDFFDALAARVQERIQRAEPPTPTGRQ